MKEIQETEVPSPGWEDALEEGMATPVFLPGKFHGQGSMAGYNLWGFKESYITEYAQVNIGGHGLSEQRRMRRKLQEQC